MREVIRFAIFGILWSLLAVSPAWPQCKEFNWPADRTKADEQRVLYEDAMKNGKHREATSGIRWFLVNVPNWNVRLYVHATEVYARLAGAEKDALKRRVLVDSLLMLYDMRIKTCGDEVNVLNRKAIHAALYFGQDKDKTGEVLKLLDRVLDISGTNVLDSNLDSYFKVVFSNFQLLKNLSADQILQRYDKLMRLIEDKSRATTNSGQLNTYSKIKATADDLLVRMVTVDCPFVKKNLEPRFRQHPDDLNLAKRIFQFMLTSKCTDDPLWLDAGETIRRLNPEKDCGLVKNLGIKYLSKGNATKAEELFKEALVVCGGSGAEKAEVLIALGTVEAQKGNKAAAREYFFQAAKVNPKSKEAYERIGDLYLSSVKECAGEKSIAMDRLVYIAAYDMYLRSGNKQKVAQARAQMPSVQEIFEQTWKEGETKPVGCWIGGSVILKTRGKE